MSGIFRIIFDCASLWIYIQAAWYILISTLYYFSIPWIVWCSLGIVTLLWLIKNPPADGEFVNQVLGVDLLRLQNKLMNESNQMSNGKEFCMRVVAHRGGGYDYPENSLSAFRNSKNKGCLAVEFDVTRTKDNIPIVFHDNTIERLTGKPGIVRNMTWDELKDLDISCNHPLREKFNGIETIALFSTVIEQCLMHDLHVIIDLKDPSLEMIQVILDAYEEYPELFKKALVTSFYPMLIYMIRRREPRIVTALSYTPRFFSSQSRQEVDDHGLSRLMNPFRQLLNSLLDVVHEWALPRFTFYVLGISAILLQKDLINQKVIADWESKGVRVMAWSVNLPSEKLHFTKIFKITYLTDTLLAEKAA